MTKYAIFKEADLPLDVVILLIAGMTSLITGVLLFPVSSGALPYYENGLYGLLLFMFALQIITMGKTPFGDMRRSKPLLAGGLVIAIIGVLTCFVPDILGQLPRMLLFVCFGPGGFLLLLQMCFAKDKLRTWVKHGGFFWYLVIGCSAVYVLSMLIALLLWKQNLLTTAMTAVVMLIYGTAITYLAGVLWKLYGTYPDTGKSHKEDVELSTDRAMLLLMGIFLMLIGIIIVPVSLKMFPFSGSAQLGLMMVIFAFQMLAYGGTPIGPFARSWPVILFGVLFAALGIVSCIIPHILVVLLTYLIGVLNILGGVIGLIKLCIPLLKTSRSNQDPVPPLLMKLFAAQIIMNLCPIMFGTSMLNPNLIPGLVIPVVLIAFGCITLYLLHLMITLDKMRHTIENDT